MAELDSVVKVGVLVPSLGQWHTQFGISLTHMMMESCRTPFHSRCSAQAAVLMSVQSSLLPFSREKILREAIKEECTHVLWLDSDMVFPKMTLHHLLRHNLPFVAANYVTKSMPATTTASKLNGKKLATTKDSTGLEEVSSVGFGCALIKVDAIKRMRAPLFMVDWYGETSSYRGEDVYFCQKFRRMTKEKIYVDHDLSRQIQHMGMYPYSLALLDRWNEGYNNNELPSPLNEQSEENENVA